MRIVMTAFNNLEILQLSLHMLFKFTDMTRHSLVVVDNSTEAETSAFLEEMSKKGYFILLDGDNSRDRGSLNHRAAIAAAITNYGTDRNEKWVLLDCDAFPCEFGWEDVLVGMLSKKNRVAGVVHPIKNYIHPSICIATFDELEKILYNENEQLKSGKFLDVLESTRIKKGRSGLEVVDSMQETGLGPPNLFTRYGVKGKVYFIHAWYYTRTNGYRQTVDGIEESVLKAARQKLIEAGLVDFYKVCIPTFGPTDVKALEEVVESFLVQDCGNNYSIDVFFCDKRAADDCASIIEKYQDDGRVFFHATLGMKRWSRAWAFNIAFIEEYAPYYIFHDRDIVVERDFVRMISRVKDLTLVNYDRVMTNGKVLKDSVGGSVTVPWKHMVLSGGFCSDMFGWGGEDREFMHRARLLCGKSGEAIRIPQAVRHIDHEGNLDQPKVNQVIKEKHAKQGVDLLRKCNYLKQDYLRYWSMAFKLNPPWDRRTPVMVPADILKELGAMKTFELFPISDHFLVVISQPGESLDVNWPSYAVEQPTTGTLGQDTIDFIENCIGYEPVLEFKVVFRDGQKLLVMETSSEMVDIDRHFMRFAESESPECWLLMAKDNNAKITEVVK